jgi:hypothetical protein
MVVVLNDSSKNNAGVVGPGSSAAGSSIKSATSATTAAASPEKDPARNLTQTFEALCLDADHQHGPAAEALLPGSCGAPPAPVVISPTSVLTPLHHDSRGNLLVPAACSTSNDSQSLETNLGGSISTAAGTKSPSTATPKKAKAGVVGVTMHPDLRRELTQSQVNRVSFYAVLHDINKEAASMAASDVLSLGPDPVDEERSPLVVAAAATLVGGGASVPSKSGDTHHQQHDASTASVGGASSTRKDNVHLGAEMATALIDEGTARYRLRILSKESLFVRSLTQKLPPRTFFRSCQRNGSCRPLRREMTPLDRVPPRSCRPWERRTTKTLSCT